MSKHKDIYIEIPHPCSQSWDEMTPSDGSGRHCAHCQKNVVDFRGYSDAALYQLFAKRPEGVCGRFFADQVNRPIAIPYQPHSRLYMMTISLGLTLLFTQTSTLLAQSRPPKADTSILKINNNDTLGKVPETSQATSNLDTNNKTNITGAPIQLQITRMEVMGAAMYPPQPLINIADLYVVPYKKTKKVKHKK